jgi:predicted HTH domain antitoxin
MMKRGAAMKLMKVDVPEPILKLLEHSRFGECFRENRVTAALAVHLFQQGEISIGKAAELSGVPRVDFELRLHELGIPTVLYGIEDYEEDKRNVKAARRKAAGL